MVGLAGSSKEWTAMRLVPILRAISEIEILAGLSRLLKLPSNDLLLSEDPDLLEFAKFLEHRVQFGADTFSIHDDVTSF